LRHMCIMNRMTNGVPYDLIGLARQARTSPAMINRFYASHLTAEMNAAQINAEVPTKEPTMEEILDEFST
jgi:hypothetical protein